MRNVQITLTHFTNESRMLKEINSLLKSGLVSEVIVIAVWIAGLKKFEKIDDRIRVIRLNPNPKNFQRVHRYLNFSRMNRQRFFFLRIQYQIFLLKPNIVNIHHVDALGIVALKYVLRKCLFIYDTHELETEVQSSVGEVKKYQQALERKYVPQVDYTFVVSPSIKEWYQNTYQIDKISTLLNTPLKNGNLIKQDLFRARFQIDKQDTIFIYNGAFFEGRGIRIMLEVFEKITDKRNHIIFMGYGDLDGLIDEYEGRNKNIHYHPAVPSDQVIEYTACADVGIHLGENSCLSYYYALPNKIFEYLIAEIPIIAPNTPDMKNFVLENKVGMVAETYEVEDVTRNVEAMAQDKTLYKEALLKAKGEFNWEKEEEKMVQVYRNLIDRYNI